MTRRDSTPPPMNTWAYFQEYGQFRPHVPNRNEGETDAAFAARLKALGFDDDYADRCAGMDPEA